MLHRTTTGGLYSIHSCEAVVGEASPTRASLPEVSLEMCSPLEFSYGSADIEVSLWHCTELLPEVSPVFVRAEAIFWKVSPTYAINSL